MPRGLSRSFMKLQRSRHPKTAERSPKRLPSSPPTNGFNGAAIRRRRRVSSARAQATPCNGFNGAAIRRRRRARSSNHRARWAQRFNGAAIRRRRRERTQGLKRRGPQGFNGAAIRRRRRAEPGLSRRSAAACASTEPPSEDGGEGSRRIEAKSPAWQPVCECLPQGLERACRPTGVSGGIRRVTYDRDSRIVACERSRGFVHHSGVRTGPL